MGSALQAQPGRWGHWGRAHHERGRQRHPGHPHQLLRAAGGRLHPRHGRGRLSRHLRGAARSRRNHAPRWRCGLRFFPHPAQGRARQGHGIHRQRAVQLHQCLRPVLRHRRERRGAPGGPDGGAAHRPPRCARIHHRQAQPRALEQFQRLGGSERRLHRCRAARPRVGAGAPGAPRRRAHRRRGEAARRRAVGLSAPARTHAVGRHHALGLRLCRTRHFVPGPNPARQQPARARNHLRHQPLWRTTAAALRLLRPRAGDPAALRAPPLQPRRRGGVRLRRLCRQRGAAGARARQRARTHPLAAAAAAPRVAGQAAHRRGFYRPRRHAGAARPALRQRRRARNGATHRRNHARRRLPRLGRAGARKRCLSAL